MAVLVFCEVEVPVGGRVFTVSKLFGCAIRDEWVVCGRWPVYEDGIWVGCELSVINVEACDGKRH